MYVCAIFLLVFGVTYLVKTNPTPIINEYYSTVTHQVVEPPKKVIVEEEICTRIDGCRIIDNVCIDCIWGVSNRVVPIVVPLSNRQSR